MKTKTWINKNTYSLEGKKIAISGATGGLGRELCLHVASLGGDLVLLVRNEKKCESLEAEIKEKYPEISVSHLNVDMEEVSSVERAADELTKMGIDMLFLNAGAYSIPRHKTTLGYDNVFTINFLSPYLLAKRLLPYLRERGGRIIAVGSIAHRYSSSDINDVDFSTRKPSNLVYGNSKRYLMTALPALSEREGEITVVHPGITFTNITAHYPRLIFALIKYPMKIIFMSPRRAALSILAGAFVNCREDEWIGPRLFDVWGLPKKRKFKIPSDEKKQILGAVKNML